MALRIGKRVKLFLAAAIAAGLAACTGTGTGTGGGNQTGIALRLDNDGSYIHDARRIDFMSDGRFQEYRPSPSGATQQSDAGNYQKAGGSITLMSDRRGAGIETLFRVEHDGTIYWVPSENLSRVAKAENSELRESALRERRLEE